MMKPEYTIAVTGLNAIDSPGPGISVIRALREAESFDVRIVGLSYESLEPGIYMDGMVDKTYQIPYPSGGVEVLYDRISYINEAENIDFIIPNFDAELFNFIKLQSRFKSELDITMFLPEMDQFQARQKANLYDYGKAHDVKVPFSQMIYNSSEIAEIAEEFGFPVVIKGKWYDARVAYTNDQAVQYFNKIAAEWGTPILVQEFVKGTEVNVCGVGDGKGGLIGAVPMRKLHITDKGKAWAGVSLEDETLINITKKLIAATSWKGAFELEFIKTDEEEYQLIEINPRFPAWCYLTVGAGQNQVEQLVNLGMGNKVKKYDTYKVGKLFIRYSYDMIVDMELFEKISTSGEL